MTYQVLARKWRPQDFSSLVGQEPIVTALRNALAEGRIAQAYLFSGIRGVGKTTAARVLAKALNCMGGDDPDKPSSDPCNDCKSCNDITTGHDIDVIEVDAATYSKVEQVRELTESLRYGTANGRYKVVVLDEVHRLSRQAFDALLKIVEEPPPHLVFIFATTEIDAVPATILSRCQEFQFRRVPSAVLAKHLRRICEAETIETSDAALRLIARAGEGSVRDSVALLDQMATFGSGTIRDEDAKNLLGGLDTAIFFALLSSILTGDRGAIVEQVREIEANGWDPHNVFGQFLLFTRDALQLAMGANPESIDLPKEEAETLGQLTQKYGYEGILRIVQLLLSSEPSVRRSEFGILALQIAWLRAAELPKVMRVEDLLTGRSQPPPQMSGGGQVSGGGGPSTPGRSTPDTSKHGPIEVGAVDAAPAVELQRRGRLSSAEGNQRIPKFLHELGIRRPSLAVLVKKCADQLTFDEGGLQIPKGNNQLEKALQRDANRSAFETLLEDILGTPGWEWSNAVVPNPAATDHNTATDHSARSNNTTDHGSTTDHGVTNRRTSPRAPERTTDREPANQPAKARVVHSPGSASGREAKREAEKHPAVQTIFEVFGGGKVQTVLQVEDPVSTDSPGKPDTTQPATT